MKKRAVASRETPSAATRIDLAPIAETLLNWAAARNFQGVDPYDALTSPFADLLSFKTRFGRISLTQLLRRSPINLRPLLRVKPGTNPKAVALFLEGVVRLVDLAAFSASASDYRRLAATLAERLLALRSPSASGAAWGYDFPWQNRFQLLPARTPTAVNTAFAGFALLDAIRKRRAAQSAIDAVASIPNFYLKDLRRLKADGSTFCFSYTPLDDNFVHNANMLGASLLARIAVEFDRSELLDPALSALEYSMKRQRADGAWFYAERTEQRWIDSFHTGFNLEALRTFLQLGLAREWQDGYRQGVEYYAANFFLEDGAPKYYADRFYLADVHAPTEALCFFATEPRFEGLVAKILNWTLENLFDRKRGTFYFRKSKTFTIKIPYMRWSQAWAFRALARLLEAEDARTRRKN